MREASGPLSPLASRLAATAPWPHGARLVAAVSGGPDSLALLVLLHQLRDAGHVALVAAHVHHGLRERDADLDARHVEEVARALDVPFELRRVDARAARVERRRGLEEAARTVRRAALEDVRARTGSDLVALAHTRDDQAETVLLRLLRGTGLDGLGGMPVSSGRFVRPLLGVRRRELREVLRDARLSWRSDGSNWGPSSARALVRGLLARVEARFNENVAENLARLADLAAEDAAWLDAAARDEASRLGLVAAPRGLEGPPAASRLRSVPDGLAALPPVLARRLVRAALRNARPDAPPPSLEAVERALEVALGRPGREAHVAHGPVRRLGADLRVGLRARDVAPREPVPLEVPGTTRWGSLGRVVASEVPVGASPVAGLPPEAKDGRQAWLDSDKIPGPLVLRARRPGDRVRPLGAAVARALGGWLKDARIPREERDLLPLACCGDEGEIAWVAGCGIGDAFKVTPATRRVLRLEWQPATTRGPA